MPDPGLETNAHHQVADFLESTDLNPIDGIHPKVWETHPGGPNTTTTRTHTQNVTHDHTQADDADLDAVVMMPSSSSANEQTSWKLDIKVLKRALVSLRDERDKNV